MNIKKYIKNPKLLFYALDERRIITMPDKEYLKCRYKLYIGKKLNLDNPKTFNEKLQWLKLYDKNPNYTKMVDKYEAKNYVGNIIGQEYIIPTLGVYDKFEDINFSELPSQFVLKCTHDSGGVVICKDKSKLNIEEAKKKLNKSLKMNFYYLAREWPYKNIKPRIIIEKYMEDEKSVEILDYKIMCFNGNAKCSFVCSDRYSEDGLKVTFFDLDWNKLPFERHYKSSNVDIAKPKNYELMIELSEKLAKDIPFVRVDWYEINGQLYFGELTFYPGGGFEEFTPDKYDEILGSWIKLPKKSEMKNEK